MIAIAGPGRRPPSVGGEHPDFMRKPSTSHDLAAILRGLEPRCGNSVVIAIDGPSGAGKSRLARQLTRDLRAATLHLDAVYRGWTALAAAPATVVHDVLRPLARGEAGRTPRWDWGAEEPGPDIVVLPRPFVLIEGCGSGSRVIRPFLSYLIWVEAPADVRRARVMERDGDTALAWWDLWSAQERELFALEGTPGAADLRLTE